MSTLDKLIAEAAHLTVQLRALEAQRKQTYRAFLASALAIANANEKRLDALENKLAETGGQAVQATLARLARALREPQWPCPSPDTNRLVRIYGDAEVAGEMALLDMTGAELQALAVRRCHRQFGDAAFGSLDADYPDHLDRQSAIRERRAELFDAMPDALTGADTLIDSEGLSVGERQRGLAIRRLKRYGGQNTQLAEWPRQATEFAANELEAVPIAKPQRVRLQSRKGRAAKPVKRQAA